MSFNLSITDKPTHVVVWTDNSNVSDLVKTLTDRVASLEETVSKLMNKGLLSGIEMRRREDSISVVQESDSKDLFKELIEKSQVKQVYIHPTAVADALAVEAEAEVISVDDADADADQMDIEVEEEEAEEEAEEAEEEAEEAEEEEAEEALELEEFEYKGVTYFKDTENQVYQVGSDGDLDDTPIGVWNAEKQKVLKYAKA
jgi:hypothetical protein